MQLAVAEQRIGCCQRSGSSRIETMEEFILSSPADLSSRPALSVPLQRARYHHHHHHQQRHNRGNGQQPPTPELADFGSELLTLPTTVPAPDKAIVDYLFAMEKKALPSLNDRAKLLQGIIRGETFPHIQQRQHQQLEEAEFQIFDESDTDPASPGWLDAMSDDGNNSVALPLATADGNDNDDDFATKGHWDPPATECTPIMIVESGGVEDDQDASQSDELNLSHELKEKADEELFFLQTSLKKGCSEVDISAILTFQGDLLVYAADALSQLPSEHFDTLIQSLVRADLSRMLQQDLAALGRHLLQAYLLRLKVIPGPLFISSVANIAFKWPYLFTHGVLLPSLKNLDRDPLLQVLNKAVGSLASTNTRLNETILLILKTLLQPAATKADSTITAKRTEQALILVETLVGKASSIDVEIVADLCQLYHKHQIELSNNRLFAKVTLDCVKLVAQLGETKTAVLQVLVTVVHPMGKIIKKVSEAKQ